ncbi:MAG: dipeptidase PepV [Peptococcaceae bacterium]|nr:dipeptidase PepV [Peptococcaceae bacterium]
MQWDTITKKYEPDLLQDLQSVIKIASVKDASTARPGAPFGSEIARALDWYLARAEAMGFRVKNVAGYAGHVEYGQGEEILAILAHLDVVPAGQDWDVDPFGGVIKDGKVIGRGAMDNKGPAMIALYALKAIKDSGVAVNKRIRIIVGTDEESGMGCVEYYLQHEEMPTLGFSPDAEFPLIHAEKGILQFQATWQCPGPLVYVSGGERPNVVPQIAEARLRGTDYAAELRRLSEGDADFKLEVEGEELKLTAFGRLAHASMPDRGKNAITHLLRYLAQLDLGPQQKLLEVLAAAGTGIYGEGLNIALADEVSGKLTANVGIIDFKEDTGYIVFDVRSPVTLPLQDTLNRAEQTLHQSGFKTQVLEFEPPHYVPKDSPLVQTLLRVYQEFTGDMSEALAIGGGTYAKKLKGGVAFGPLLPGREDVAHISNEYMSIADINLSFKIYTKAILELAQT